MEPYEAVSSKLGALKFAVPYPENTIKKPPVIRRLFSTGEPIMAAPIFPFLGGVTIFRSSALWLFSGMGL